MAVHKCPTIAPSPPPSSDEATAPGRAAAVAALVHRMNGGLNNAALAIELALGAPAEGHPLTEQSLRAGLAAIAQASRAAMLISQIVRPQGTTGEPVHPYMQDVREILRDHAQAARGQVSEAFEVAAGDAHASPADAARLLVSELARIDGAR